MRRSDRVAGVAALAIALVAGSAACGARPPRGPAATTPAAPARTGALEDRFILTGELAATRSHALRVPRTPTFMIAIKWMVDDGALVKAGDRVIEFDTASLSGSLADRRLAVQRAESELASQIAKAAADEADKRMEAERKRVALEKARADASVPADLRTRREHQEKQLAVAREADALKKAEEALATELRSARLETRIKEIALARARRDLVDVETRLEQLTVRAPRDGLVQVSNNFRGEMRKFQIGDQAYAGMEVATMPELAELEVRARLYDVDEGAVKVGMKAECVLDAYPDRRYAGAVASVTPIARQDGRDAVRRVFDVLVKLERTDAETMLPGMSVRVEVIRRRVEGARLVPRQALRTIDGRTYGRVDGHGETPVEIEVCDELECAIRVPAPAARPGGGRPS